VALATFVATAELAADGRGRTLQPGELQEWQNYHEKMFADPRFHQMAAERFQRLGMASVGTPTDVKRLVEERIRWRLNPGQMALHLQGQGSRNTERMLNTFAAAFASHANAAQTARTDGGVTRVTQEARTGDEPIDNTRTYWALAMMGIGTSICFFVATALWKKLAGARRHLRRVADRAIGRKPAGACRWTGDGAEGSSEQEGGVRTRSTDQPLLIAT
jgi:hypothetical protein